MRKRSSGTSRVALVTTAVALLAVTAVSAQGQGRHHRNGQAVYDEHCLRCHGLNGQGDGPDAKRLIVPPGNLQSPRTRSRADFELMTIIGYGVPYSPMHAWRGHLTEEEILDVIDYLRTLGPPEPSG